MLITHPESQMEAVTEPERPDGFITLGPRVVLDRAQQGRDGFKLIRVYWRYWENRAIVDRAEEDRRRASEG
jgi:hypothetical protein